MFSKKEDCKCEPVNCFEDKVKCETCKCWVDKKDAQLQRQCGYLGMVYEYYCQAHKKPYDKMIFCMPDNLYYYYKEVRVDKNGEPYGYVKIKEEKPNDKPRKKN